jgi:hypothetical protein
MSRTLLGTALVLTISACEPAAGPAAKPSEAPGMWSGVQAIKRAGIAPLAPAHQPSRPWAPELTEEERERCKEVAWNAIVSPETWAHYFESPATAAGLTNLSETGIRYSVDQSDFSTVDVAIPSGAFIGWHPTYIGVTVARGSYEVLDMDASFWP